MKLAAEYTAGHEIHGQTALYDEDESGRNLAIVYDGAAHAALIVKAVNHHSELVAALQNAISGFGELAMRLHDIGTAATQFESHARELLQRIEEEN